MSPKTQDVANLSNGNIYLVFYNVFLSLGWLIVLIQTVHHLVYEVGSLDGLWESTSSVLKIFQSLAILEVLHAAVGLVPSSVAMVIPQVTSRLVILWPVLCAVNNTHSSIGLPMLLVAWSVTEVIRYAYYFLSILKHVPSILTFLRYTLFIVLYPVGVTGELLCLYAALPTVAKTRMYSVSMPNALNATFDLHSTLIVFALLYLPVFPMLYMHMFAQRKKVLGKSKKVD
ncbi:very-long-chain (3R)-3-hydroxyacyl-CoA dehydratase hpo-8-like [Portunus trituberculatus]|uniref:very-long-chain (3R)-3-hydroxyacyl-CoA dehydratase hpo-8-like n=1 Tax=Portunus trituberculatus TaxID=210409 RepID=UPI001E1D0417|nr:very-long-chain (3R)-3-hydroxyacyl-CoA dehydratase hpo-8-like [Portunus trituberculatus]XP_045111422.1 very-long-chain (3R)-3-hydroxyacyl-CoA dehydratase hpo-8-like [Portunus trituberculatus]XP_045111423.1 very-long-chain (3R)-3-hydroxyacyl-CoA dehydratase hpo-8-like [Portunus trituberculatus]XP_045111424.1 very-long-chain (3R)-3-hydroxyacyl-CoA dehydratase hpo-8-like [Portunus trituberculatus]